MEPIPTVQVYQYSHLKTASSIRLLHLTPAPAGSSEPLQCTIHDHDLDVPSASTVLYEATSYVWGQDKATILCDGSPLRIPKSLADFLVRTRSILDAKGKVWHRIFWADSICINQDNLAERAAQVKMMGRVYQSAWRTVAWLGKAADDSDVAFGLTRKLYKRHMFLHVNQHVKPVQRPRDEMTHREWISLCRLLNRSYFKRAWIVQECILSNKTILVCGMQLIEWMHLLLAVANSTTEHTWVFDYYPFNAEMQSYCGVMIASYVEFKLRKDQPQSSRKAYEVIARHRHMKATEAVDHILAFYGLGVMEDFSRARAEATNDLQDKVDSIVTDEDKQRAARTLFIDFAIASLEHTADLDFLSVPQPVITGNDVDEEDAIKPLHLPSWVPDWSRSEGVHTSLLRVESRSIEVMPLAYNATQSSVSRVQVELDIPSRISPRLQLSGYIVDTISDASSTWKLLQWEMSSHQTQANSIRYQAGILQHNQTLIYSWASIFGLEGAGNNSTDKYDETGEYMHQVLIWICTSGIFRTSPEDTQADFVQFQRRQRWIQMLRFNITGWNLHRYILAYMVVVFIETWLAPVFGYVDPEQPFRRQVGVMGFRRAARTSNKHWVALVPGNTRPGDQVAMLMGGKTPFVVRARENGEWQLVGDCYVHGIMQGEAWSAEECVDMCFV